MNDPDKPVARRGTVHVTTPIRYVAAVAAFFVSSSIAGIASGQEFTTLDEVLGAAARNAAVLDEHDAKIEIANWQQYRANHAWTPKLKSDTLVAPVPAEADPWNFGNNLDTLGEGRLGPFVSQKLTIVVPIFTFGRISTAQDLAALGVEKAEADRELAARDVEFQVTRAYRSMQLSKAFSDLLGEGTELVDTTLENMEEAREFGEAEFETSALRQLQVLDAELDSRVADNALLGRIAHEGLRYFTGYPDDRTVAVPSLDDVTEVPPLGTVEEYQLMARANRPELRQLEMGVKARALQAKLERSNFFPNIVILGDLGLGWSTEEIALRSVCRTPTADSACVDTQDLYARPYEDPLHLFTLGVGLGMRWELDFFQQYGKYKAAVAQNEEVAAQKRRAVGAIELEISKLWLDASTAYQKIEITSRRLEAARRWRDQYGLSVQTGGGDMKDAVDPLKAYFEAKALHLQAKYDYLVARAALAKGVGVSKLPSTAAPASE